MTRRFTEKRDPQTGERWIEVEATGVELTDQPMLNKGTAFSEDERGALRLRGLLPPKVTTIAEQMERVLAGFDKKHSDLDRYVHLIALLDRNETLFYRTVLANIEQMLPIIYTPTVGQACQQF